MFTYPSCLTPYLPQLFHPPLLTSATSPFLGYLSCLTLPLLTPAASPFRTYPSCLNFPLLTLAVSPSLTYPSCLNLPCFRNLENLHVEAISKLVNTFFLIFNYFICLHNIYFIQFLNSLFFFSTVTYPVSQRHVHLQWTLGWRCLSPSV